MAGVERVLVSDSPKRTRELGARLAPLLVAGDAIVLAGDLGAGKTCFTQGLAQGLGCVGHVTSPTFVILHQLQGRLLLYHFDLYRIETAAEFADLAVDELLDGDGVSVLEWGDRFSAQLPTERLELVFHFEDDTRRRIDVRVLGDRWRRVIEEWSASC